MQGWFRDAMVRRLRRILADHLPVGKLVDIGCAVGDWTLRYAQYGFAPEIVGIDLSPHFLELARAGAGRLCRELAAGPVAAPTMRFVEENALTTGELAGADLVCMGGFIQCLPEEAAEALLGRVAAAQSARGAIYLRTNVTTDGTTWRGTSYYRPASWYEALFRRLGYRSRDMHASAAIPIVEYAAGLGPIARGLGRLAGWGHSRFSQRGRLQFVNWVLVRDGT